MTFFKQKASYVQSALDARRIPFALFTIKCVCARNTEADIARSSKTVAFNQQSNLFTQRIMQVFIISSRYCTAKRTRAIVC